MNNVIPDPENVCDVCNGQGWYADHDAKSAHNPYDGTCLTCPVQVQCEKCKGTGFITEGTVITSN